MQQHVVASCVFGSALARSIRTPLVATVGGPTAEIHIAPPSTLGRRLELSVSTAAAVGEAIQLDAGRRTFTKKLEASRDGHLRGPRLNGKSPRTKELIDTVLATYFCGGALTILRTVGLLAQTVSAGWHWQPFVIPAAAGFAFIPLGWAGYLVFSGDGTCSYTNSALNFIIPVSDLPACGGRRYNFPEFLMELITLSAAASAVYVILLSRYFKAQFERYTEPHATWLLLGCKLLGILGVAAMVGLVGVAWIPTHFYKLIHRGMAYVFFVNSVWMLSLYGLLVLCLPDGHRRPFLPSACMGTLLWILMALYGVQFTFNFCDRLCGGGNFNQEPYREPQQRAVLVLYEKYRWCLSLESVAEWLIVAMYAFWVLLAPATATLPCPERPERARKAEVNGAIPETHTS